MKSKRKLLAGVMLSMMLLIGAGIQAQDLKPGDKKMSDEKWDVRKEYDEHGNMIYYDSSYSRNWKNFEFPEFEAGQPFENLDTLFGDFFLFPDHPLGYHPFVLGPFSEFMDSMDLDFYRDSLIFQPPHVFMPFPGMPDSAWMDSFFPDFQFPDAYLQFHPRLFADPHDFFKGYHDWMERFFDEFTLPDDSSNHFYPKWQRLPHKQKKPAQGTEI